MVVNEDCRILQFLNIWMNVKPNDAVSSDAQFVCW